MKFPHYALLSALAAALVFLGFRVGAVPPPAPDRMQARFEIFGFGGLHLLTNNTRLETSAGRYAIAMDMTTRGLASVFVNLDSHSQVRGWLNGDAAQPQQYSGETRRDGTDRRSRIEYGTDGTVLSTEVFPPVEQPISVATDRTRGTVDQLTAYFLVERQLAQHNTCKRVVAVFDGNHRYDLHFRDAPPEPLPAGSSPRYQGPVRLCEMTRKDIAGPADHSEGAYRGRIWYAWVGRRDLMMPVEMEFDTTVGLVKGHLAELQGRDLDLRFE